MSLQKFQVVKFSSVQKTTNRSSKIIFLGKSRAVKSNTKLFSISLRRKLLFDRFNGAVSACKKAEQQGKESIRKMRNFLLSLDSDLTSILLHFSDGAFRNNIKAGTVRISSNWSEPRGIFYKTALCMLKPFIEATEFVKIRIVCLWKFFGVAKNWKL